MVTLGFKLLSYLLPVKADKTGGRYNVVATEGHPPSVDPQSYPITEKVIGQKNTVSETVQSTKKPQLIMASIVRRKKEQKKINVLYKNTRYFRTKYRNEPKFKSNSVKSKSKIVTATKKLFGFFDVMLRDQVYPYEAVFIGQNGLIRLPLVNDAFLTSRLNRIKHDEFYLIFKTNSFDTISYEIKLISDIASTMVGYKDTLIVSKTFRNYKSIDEINHNSFI